MKQALSKYKGLLLVLVNTIPYAINVVFYDYGQIDDLVFLPFYFILVLLNIRNCEKPMGFILIQGYVLACIILSGYFSTWLYYQNVNTYLTIPIGMMFTIVEAVTHILVTVAALFFQAKVRKDNTQADDNN